MGVYIQRHGVARTANRERRLVPKQSDFGFWPANDGVRVSSLAEEARYGVITDETLSDLFDNRMLVADLLSHSADPQEAFWASLVLQTLSEIRKELKRRIS